MEDFKELIERNYGKNVCTQVEGGVIWFDPDSLKKIAGAENMTYDEYIDIQIRSLGQYRSSFEACYVDIPMSFKGQIEKMAKNRACFHRIFVSGMYPDGEMFDGKEDHVWMSNSGFESFQVGDCLEFFAEVYRYVKTSNGKLIDYSLRNPANIEKIDSYELPSDDDLVSQALDQIICATCWLNEQCSGTVCTRNPKKQKRLQRQMLEVMKRNVNP